MFGAEYFDVRAATKAVQTLNGARIGDCTFTVRHAVQDDQPDNNHMIPPPPFSAAGHPDAAFAPFGYGRPAGHPTIVNGGPPSSFSSASHADLRQPQTSSNQHEHFRTQHARVFSPSVRSSLTRTYSFPSGSSDWPHITQIHRGDDRSVQSQSSRWSDPNVLQNMLDHMSLAARGIKQITAHQPAPLHNPQAIPLENVIHRDRIINGLDKRTTVMIKDVPNKLSRGELVHILRDVVPNEFDFVYLRFDFNNHCNVGYAFVNFTSTHSLLTFVDRKAGRKWNMFASEKVLQVRK